MANQWIDRFNSQIINYIPPWKIQFTNAFRGDLKLCVRFFIVVVTFFLPLAKWIGAPLFCTALLWIHQVAIKLARKMTKSIIERFFGVFFTNWHDRFMSVCDWHSQRREKQTKKKCEGADQIHWLLFEWVWVSDWSACHLCNTVHKAILNAHVMHFIIWNYDH